MELGRFYTKGAYPDGERRPIEGEELSITTKNFTPGGVKALRMNEVIAGEFAIVSIAK